jgi:hypothetical protein
MHSGDEAGHGRHSHQGRRLAWSGAWHLSFLVGIASLLWFLIRTGSKPSRASYPCQRASLANASAWLGTLALPAAVHRARRERELAAHEGWRAGSTPLRFALLFVAAAGLAVIAGKAVDLLSRTPAAPAGQSVSLTLARNQLPAGTFSDIYAVQGTTGADAGFRRLVDSMQERGQSFYSLFNRNDVLIIKVNSQWDERGGTNTDLVKTIIEEILAHPDGFAGEIVIADNGQGQYGAAGRGGSLDWKSNNAVDRSQSMQKVAAMFSPRHKVSTVSWDLLNASRVEEFAKGDARDGYVVDSSPSPDTGIVVSYPKFTTRYGTRISFKNGLWDPAAGGYDSERLKVVNVPVLKSHSIYGVTASVKHYMGVVSNRLSGNTSHGSVGTGGMGTEMAQTRFPVLNILDAVWINAAPGRGPRTTYSQATQANIVAVSRDPVALDYWAAKNILLPAARKLGYGSTDSLDPEVNRKGFFGYWLRLSMKALQKAGYPVTLDLDRVNISVTSLEDFRLD